MPRAVLVAMQEGSNLPSVTRVILQGSGTLHLPTTSEDLMEKNVCIY